MTPKRKPNDMNWKTSSVITYLFMLRASCYEVLKECILKLQRNKNQRKIHMMRNEQENLQQQIKWEKNSFFRIHLNFKL